MSTFIKYTTLIVALALSACAGPEGANGKDGMGAMGVDGTDGMNGAPGAPGATGPAGRDGKDGVDGQPGQPGAPGKDGAQGEIGPAGEKGDRGDMGPQGLVGPVGPQGVQGPAGPQGVAGPQGPQGPAGAKGDPGSFVSAIIVTCSQQSKVTTSDGRVIVRYWAKVDDAKINTNSIALAGAYTCSRFTSPMGQDICKQNGVTCEGDPNPWPDCMTTPVNIETGRIWVSCGVQDQQGGIDINTDKFATAHIMYKLGG